MLSTWIGWVKRGLPRGKSGRRPGGRCRPVRPQLEPLEDRCLPTSIVLPVGTATALLRGSEYARVEMGSPLLSSYSLSAGSPDGEAQPQETTSFNLMKVVTVQPTGSNEGALRSLQWAISAPLK